MKEDGVPFPYTRISFRSREDRANAWEIVSRGKPTVGLPNRGMVVDLDQLMKLRDAFLATGMPTSTYYAAQGLAERTDLGGLNLSNVPKVFIETGNMRNSTDTSLLEDAGFRQREAQQLAVGLDQFLAGR